MEQTLATLTIQRHQTKTERERERESTTKKTKIDEQHVPHKKTWVNPGVHEW
jgi:hypothetical protein